MFSRTGTEGCGEIPYLKSYSPFHKIFHSPPELERSNGFLIFVMKTGRTVLLFLQIFFGLHGLHCNIRK